LIGEGRLAPLAVIVFGNLAARIKDMHYVGELLFSAVGEMWKSACSICQNPFSPVKR
jgi:hypothetical protein